mgnify:CR=1 FL=1
MKSFLIYALLSIVLLSGCSKQEISENTQNSAYINFDKSETTVHDVTDNQLSGMEITVFSHVTTKFYECNCGAL